LYERQNLEIQQVTKLGSEHQADARGPHRQVTCAAGLVERLTGGTVALARKAKVCNLAAVSLVKQHVTRRQVLSPSAAVSHITERTTKTVES
jgi:hypothetical protein